MKDVTIYGLHIAKKTRIIGVIVVGSTLFSIGLNILLIPVWGITGAAIATLLSQMAYWYATHYFSQKAYYVPYETSKLLILLVTGALFSFSGLLLNDLTLIPRLSLKTGLLVSFPFMLYLLGFYEPVEIDYIKGFVAKWSDLRNLRTNLNSLRGLSEIE